MRATFSVPTATPRWKSSGLMETSRASTPRRSTSATAPRCWTRSRNLQPTRSCTAPRSRRHDLARRSRPFDDFDVNAVGTLNLLEAARRHCAETPFVLMSTNKVYGDRPNDIATGRAAKRAGITPIPPTTMASRDVAGSTGATHPLRRLQSRRRRDGAGIRALLRDEDLLLPRRLPDRADHSGVELHGFLSYLVKCASKAGRTRCSATRASRCATTSTSCDVARFFELSRAPRVGEVYNLGGGREAMLRSSKLRAHRRRRQTGKLKFIHYMVPNRQRRSHLLHFGHGEIPRPLSPLVADAAGDRHCGGDGPGRGGAGHVLTLADC